MVGLGLQLPSAGAPVNPMYAGGTVRMESAASVMSRIAAAARDRASAAAQEQVVVGLAGHVRKCWAQAKTAKEPIEREMLSAVRARRGEYDPEKLAEIKASGGSEIYMMLFSTKARQAAALIRDAMLGAGTDKPWTLHPTAMPDIPPDQIAEIMSNAYAQVTQAEMSGMPMSVDDVREMLKDYRERTEAQVMELARERTARMERKMEDQLQEGNWLMAFDEFIDDLTTFKTAFLKGPVVRKRLKMRWNAGGPSGYQLELKDEFVLEWERVSPFHIYPAPWSRGVNDAYLIERHQLDRGSLEAMIGVEGYSEAAIRTVLDEFGRGGLHDWMQIDTMRAQAEGRDSSVPVQSSDLIDAIQFWGAVSGKMLVDWGMDPAKVPDQAKEYEAEVWLIGSHVIKATINTDPLKRRGYYATGFERIPGAFWHNSLFDVIRDCCDMCNAAARALANNLGIASGPQVVVNVDRLPIGEKITNLFPWKIHQTTSDPMGSTALPVTFFQPDSNANELMAVYERFSILADEHSGVPRYMTGGEGTQGAGRTASGLSMMIGNAGKTIKAVVANIDGHVVSQALNRLYYYNMRYGDDPDLKGDVNVVARGAMSLMVKESAQVRRNEFLARTANPIDMQIMGPEGRAYLLRESARTLDLDTDKIVPSLSLLKAKQFAAMGLQPPAAGGGSGQELMNGAPVTDNFGPVPG